MPGQVSKPQTFSQRFLKFKSSIKKHFKKGHLKARDVIEVDTKSEKPKLIPDETTVEQQDIATRQTEKNKKRDSTVVSYRQSIR